MTGEMLVDAGELAEDASMLLQDAARALSDASGALNDAAASLPPDAQAQTGPQMLTAACDKVYTYTQTQPGGGSSIERTDYFAEFPVTDASTITGLDVVRCQREVFGGMDPLSPCPAGWTCTGTPRPPIPDCDVYTNAELEPRLLRVNCGYRYGAAPWGTGWRFNQVRVTVRR
jgi:hypothetical protein